MDHPIVSPERLRRTLDFIERAYEQLTEKRNNAKTLVAAEDLYVDEKKFCRLLHINLTSLSTEEQYCCASLIVDLGELTDDLKISREYRLKYRAERQGDLDEINRREGLCTPCPTFKTEVTFLCDDLLITPNQFVPEFIYRARQGGIFFERLLEQHCSTSTPEEREATEKPPPPQGLSQAPCKVYPVSDIPCPTPRVNYREYLLRPGASYFEEYARVVKAFMEETITQGPEKNNLLEFLPLVQFDL